MSANKDMLVVALIFNIALLNTFSFSLISSAADASLFSYGWTFRLGSKDPSANMQEARASITKMYSENRLSSKAALGDMLDNIYKVAQCRSAAYDGGLQWSPGEVSPTCNCLRNMHVEYIKSVTPMGVNLTSAEMANNDTAVKTSAVITAIQKKCFNAIRHTQVSPM
jgi:hypothetical protein